MTERKSDYDITPVAQFVRLPRCRDPEALKDLLLFLQGVASGRIAPNGTGLEALANAQHIQTDSNGRSGTHQGFEALWVNPQIVHGSDGKYGVEARVFSCAGQAYARRFVFEGDGTVWIESQEDDDVPLAVEGWEKGVRELLGDLKDRLLNLAQWAMKQRSAVDSIEVIHNSGSSIPAVM